MSAASEYVLLRRGLAIPLDPVLLLLELEARAFTLTADGDYLLVQPRSKLTAHDCTRIRKWKVHLLALVEYTPPGGMQ